MLNSDQSATPPTRLVRTMYSHYSEVGGTEARTWNVADRELPKN